MSLTTDELDERDELFEDLYCPILGIMTNRPITTWTDEDRKTAKMLFELLRPDEYQRWSELLNP